MVQGDALITQHLPVLTAPSTLQTSTTAKIVGSTQVPAAAEPQAQANRPYTSQSAILEHKNLLLAAPARRRPPASPASGNRPVNTLLDDVGSKFSSGKFAVQPDVFGTLQGELLSHVLQQVNWTSKEAITLSSVCR